MLLWYLKDYPGINMCQTFVLGDLNLLWCPDNQAYPSVYQGSFVLCDMYFSMFIPLCQKHPRILCIWNLTLLRLLEERNISGYTRVLSIIKDVLGIPGYFVLGELKHS